MGLTKKRESLSTSSIFQNQRARRAVIWTSAKRGAWERKEKWCGNARGLTGREGKKYMPAFVGGAGRLADIRTRLPYRKESNVVNTTDDAWGKALHGKGKGKRSGASNIKAVQIIKMESEKVRKTQRQSRKSSSSSTVLLSNERRRSWQGEIAGFNTQLSTQNL